MYFIPNLFDKEDFDKKKQRPPHQPQFSTLDDAGKSCYALIVYLSLPIFVVSLSVFLAETKKWTLLVN